MVRRKGELSKRQLNAKWPHQVALPQLADGTAQYDRHELIDQLCESRTKGPRGHTVAHDGRWWDIDCFADPADAAWFLQRFEGVAFDPRDQGTGHNWARWEPGAARARALVKTKRG